MHTYVYSLLERSSTSIMFSSMIVISFYKSPHPCAASGDLHYYMVDVDESMCKLSGADVGLNIKKI